MSKTPKPLISEANRAHKQKWVNNTKTAVVLASGAAPLPMEKAKTDGVDCTLLSERATMLLLAFAGNCVPGLRTLLYVA